LPFVQEHARNRVRIISTRLPPGSRRQTGPGGRWQTSVSRLFIGIEAAPAAFFCIRSSP
jgi:hypothetical protein